MRAKSQVYLSIHAHTHIYTYTYTKLHMRCIHMYIYIYIYMDVYCTCTCMCIPHKGTPKRMNNSVLEPMRGRHDLRFCRNDLTPGLLETRKQRRGLSTLARATQASDNPDEPWPKLRALVHGLAVRQIYVKPPPKNLPFRILHF